MEKALLIVDPQKIYTNPDSDLYCENANKTIEKINMLIENASHNGTSIFIIKHIHKSDGSDLGRMFDYAGDDVEDFEFEEGTDYVELDANLDVPERSITIIKNRYSSFAGTDLNKRLTSLKIKRLIICGFMTNFCCESTARDGHDLDYFVDFIIDATGTPGTTNMDQMQIRNIVAELLDEGFACVYNTNEYING